MTDEVHKSGFHSLSWAFVHSSTFSENSFGDALASWEANFASNCGQHLPPYEMVKEVRGEGMLTGIEFQPPSNLSMRSEIKGCFQGDVGVSPHPGF
jgi:acetylornithine/succinyldiaminopimelate/putrescine aminotransferase